MPKENKGHQGGPPACQGPTCDWVHRKGSGDCSSPGERGRFGRRFVFVLSVRQRFASAGRQGIGHEDRGFRP